MKSNKKKGIGRIASAVLLTIVIVLGLSSTSALFFARPTTPVQKPSSPINQKNMVEQVSLTTSDGKTISGTLYNAQNPKGWIVYLHMMPQTKESYTTLATTLAQNGYAGLAIDFRGHGASTGGPDGYKAYTDAEHKGSINDVTSALEYIKTKGAVDGAISIVGASIGANIALASAAQNPAVVSRVVALSPGLNYRGVTTKDVVSRVQKNQRVLFMASEDDVFSAKETNELFGIVPTGVLKEKELYKKAGHGTDMLTAEPLVQNRIITFLTN